MENGGDPGSIPGGSISLKEIAADGTKNSKEFFQPVGAYL